MVDFYIDTNADGGIFISDSIEQCFVNCINYLLENEYVICGLAIWHSGASHDDL
ncbi:MAG: hypothetical protein K6B68_18315 [Eubacterium sp.]|nr:hypothetical protein [Eubacterium sp.]